MSIDKPSLPYATQRKVDDFCSGKSLAGYGYWVRVLAEPSINDRHMTVVRVELAYGEAEGLVSIGEHIMTVYPSTLDELDTYLQGGWDPNEWVHIEAAWQEYGAKDKEGNRKRSKKYKLIQTVRKGLDATSGPSKPAAVSIDPAASSERGQPGAGGEPASALPVADEPPANPPCPHTSGKAYLKPVNEESAVVEGFYCKDCGERVG